MQDIFDLDLTAAADEGSVMTVRHPVTGEDMTYTDENGQVKPIRIFVKGNDSPAFRNRMDYHLRKNSRNKRADPTIAEMEDQSSDLLASVTTGWEGMIWIVDGVKAPLACTRENAKMIYKARGWLRKQVDEFVADADNFLHSNGNS